MSASDKQVDEFGIAEAFKEPKETRMPATHRQVGGTHYRHMKIQPAMFSEANKLSFLEGSVVKRVCRWRQKGGIEDLRKAVHELELLIETVLDGAENKL